MEKTEENENALAEAASGVSPDEMSGLFSMQLHCGLSGFVLSLVWLGCVSIAVGNLFQNGGAKLGICGALILVPFIAAAWIGGWISGWSNETFHANEVTLRRVLSSLSACCVFSMTVLIWVTGGANSPFTPLYIMTHSLTLGKIATPGYGRWLLLWFAIPLSIGYLGYFFFGSGIAQADMQAIIDSPLHYVSLAAGGFLSLAISTLSNFLVAQRNKRR